ncbi:DHH family phosphoesterase [Patescibacteria group bacterium]|nr:DHH family phosphoesterase [Patescibacteria group bacterium]
MLQYNKEFKQLIEKSKNILIITHKSPDMDAFCSMIMVKKFIELGYPKMNVVMKARQTPTINIPCMKEIHVAKEIKEGDEDLIIVVDAGSMAQCLDYAKDNLQDTSKPIVVIDHHTETTNSKGDLIINEIRSSATEQVFATFKDIYGKNFKITPDIAQLTQYGIVADTGRFLYDSTTPDTLRVYADAKQIMDIDIEEMSYKIGKFPRESIPAVITYLKTLQIEKDMAYVYVTEDMIVQDGLTKQGVNEAQAFLRDKYIRFIQGVHWGFIIKPDFDYPDSWFVSFRSTKGYQDVGIIAKELGGGGHEYAAASPLKATTGEEALEKVLEVVHKITGLAVS